MIDFSGISYKSLFNIFSSVIYKFNPQNNIKKEQNFVIFGDIDGIRYKIIVHRNTTYSTAKFVKIEHDKEMVYSIVSDEDNFVKAEQPNPPILKPVEFINEIIDKLEIKDLVTEEMRLQNDLSLIVSKL